MLGLELYDKGPSGAIAKPGKDAIVSENAMFPEAEQMLADQLEDLMDHMVALKQQLTKSPQQ